MHEQRGATAWCGRLLLFAALLLGIVTMHTLGHPRHDAAAAAHGSGAHAGSAAQHAHETEAHQAVPALHAAPVRPAPEGAAQPAPGGLGMDPSSVCLAVLGAGLLLLVLRELFRAAQRRFRAPGVRIRAALLRALWPIPPPPRGKSLARLSVLRT
ncbi:hypothetical protein ACFP1Z_28210 [Streptomyces gamaensis]|uniref:Uncharacterized protein n=1 Tax=Streptomyces gamaensis TaxID=1763542 RepID=A0ABW0Z8D5_9ACTN